MEREHVKYFDYLRVFGAVSVVFMHTASQPLTCDNTNIVWIFLVIGTSMAFTAVPLFFMMSGYLILTSRKTKDISVLFKHRLPHLLMPLLFWTVIVIIWVMWKDNQISVWHFTSYMFSSLSTPIMQHFWYLYTLSAIYIISPLLYRGINNLQSEEKRYIFVVIILVILQTMITIAVPDILADKVAIKPLVDLKLLGGHLVTFVLGYYLGNIKRKIPNILLISIIIIDWAVISGCTVVLSKGAGEYIGKFQDQSAGFSILLAACVFLLFKQNITNKKRKFNVTPFVNLSLGIYMMHNLLNRILSFAGWEASGLRGTLGKTLVILVVCYFVLKTLATIKPLCFMATGISYGNACKTCNWVYTYNKLRNIKLNF